ENITPLPRRRRRDRRQIFSRMKFCLVCETHAGCLHFRNGLDVGGVKAEFVRERRVLAKTLALVLRSAAEGSMEKARNASEFALDPFLPDQLVDLIDRRGARIPRRLRVILSEIFRHLVETQIGDVREMGGGIPG